MAKAPSILNADRGRASATALGVLCLLAAVQIFLVIQAFWKGAEGGTEAGKPAISQQANPLAAPVSPVLPTVSFSPPSVGQLAPAAPAAVSPMLADRGFAPPAIGSFAPPPGGLQPPASVPGPAFSPPAIPLTAPLPPLTAPVSTPEPAPVPDPVPAVPAAPSDSVASMTLEEMIELAKQVRGLGDMQGALEVLKRADLQYPGRPEVLAETAQCYETMGLADKAAAVWRQLESMDPSQAAGFRDLAQRRLSAPAPASPSLAPGFSALMGGEGAKMLSLGACVAVRDPSVVNGEKVVLRIPILRQGNTTLDPSQVDIDVYFFDRVNGEKIAQTIADEPVSTWASLPVDWSGIGEEPLDVTYFLPALTPGEIAAHGRRSYHGYVVRLYYQHKLQDVAAEPRDLLDFGSRTPQTVPGGVNPLLPPLTN
ncbi:tetratricopeptide repeat protein [Prosthecobacter sp. SYSU 5D2]|uniref:tetratricopeptide repeat protein n=1 Tax=Prosthecobacter sp. SYSU 5D2 TaxID=3134134 RepID=UPI0031FEA75E